MGAPVCSLILRASRNVENSHWVWITSGFQRISACTCRLASAVRSRAPG